MTYVTLCVTLFLQETWNDVEDVASDVGNKVKEFFGGFGRRKRVRIVGLEVPKLFEIDLVCRLSGLSLDNVFSELVLELVSISWWKLGKGDANPKESPVHWRDGRGPFWFYARWQSLCIDPVRLATCL